jgi:predicted hotdog family 3-hydroxylacyl-ACP dehydratase
MSAFLPDHAWIAAHIPHHGAMCLIDRVTFCDATRLTCRAHSHRAADNPLRSANGLGIANGIEYAAQAMAIHGALLHRAGSGNSSAPAAGLLTSVRHVRWQRQRLDDLADDLDIDVERLAGNELNILYQFSLHCAGERLLSGRATVLLDAGRI